MSLQIRRNHGFTRVTILLIYLKSILREVQKDRCSQLLGQTHKIENSSRFLGYCGRIGEPADRG